MQNQLLLSAFLFTCVATASPAEEIAPTVLSNGCAMTSQSKIIRIVICEDVSISQISLADVGKEACAEALPCGAWIWHDRQAAPTIAPENHDGLSQAQVTSARAIWVAEQENLVEISKVNN